MTCLVLIDPDRLRESIQARQVVPRATTFDRVQEVDIQILDAVIEAIERRVLPGNY